MSLVPIAILSDAERKHLAKEIQGLEAKLRWDHISDGVKAAYERRIEELQRRLKPGD